MEKKLYRREGEGVDVTRINEGEFLGSSELHALTGFARAAEQEAWLKERGIPYRRDRKRIIVSRFHARSWLEGREVVTSQGPNWSALNA